MSTALDLFRGAGGWSVAAHELGITDLGVEIMPEANATAEAAGFTTLYTDVWEPGDHLQGITLDGLIASPPCQTFSKAGGGKGRSALDALQQMVPQVKAMTLAAMRDMATEIAGDDRTALVLTPLWYALHHRPTWLAFEQVPGVLPAWEAFAVELRHAGYNVWTGMVQSEQYGAPQTRKRAILIASLDHEVDRPTPTHSQFHNRTPGRLDAGVLPWVSMAEALGWAPGGRVFSPTNLRPRTTFRADDQPAPTLAFGHDEPRWTDAETAEDICYKVRAIVEPRVNNQSGTEFDLAWPAYRPAPTIAGRELVTMPGANANRFNGSTKSRNDGIKATIEEIGVLQTFPADHPWRGGKSSQFTQAGNAVPPLLAKAILQAVI